MQATFVTDFCLFPVMRALDTAKGPLFMLVVSES
jgi:hypothetical protein